MLETKGSERVGPIHLEITVGDYAAKGAPFADGTLFDYVECKELEPRILTEFGPSYFELAIAGNGLRSLLTDGTDTGFVWLVEYGLYPGSVWRFECELNYISGSDETGPYYDCYCEVSKRTLIKRSMSEDEFEAVIDLYMPEVPV